MPGERPQRFQGTGPCGWAGSQNNQPTSLDQQTQREFRAMQIANSCLVLYQGKNLAYSSLKCVVKGVICNIWLFPVIFMYQLFKQTWLDGISEHSLDRPRIRQNQMKNCPQKLLWSVAVSACVTEPARPSSGGRQIRRDKVDPSISLVRKVGSQPKIGPYELAHWS